MNVKKFIVGKVVVVVLVGGLVIGFGSVVVIVVNVVVGDILVDFFGNMLGDFGGDVSCYCCEDLLCFGDCCGCFVELGCDFCGDICGGCGDFLGIVCELFFECFCGIFFSF